MHVSSSKQPCDLSLELQNVMFMTTDSLEAGRVRRAIEKVPGLLGWV